MPSTLLSREAVSEADRPGAQDRAQRQQHAMARICAINNANVTRDYGTHTADFSRPVRDLAADELADVPALVKVAYAEPASFDRRRTAQAYVPDLPAVPAHGPSYAPDSATASGGDGDFAGGGASGSWD